MEPLSVALIGPHEKRRWAVADGLARTQRAAVREFDSYPPEGEHLPRLLGAFDAILVDGDSDPEIALEIVEALRGGDRATVLIYSEKSDRTAATRFLRAGAREHLVLPLDAEAFSEALLRATTLRPKLVSAEKPMGKLLVVAGSKGGSGVTTVACHMAASLARVSEKSTLLIDLALPIGDAALYLGLTPELSTEEALRNVDHLDATLLEQHLVRHGSGVFVLAAPSRVPDLEVSQEAIEKLIGVARRRFDHVVVDVGSRIDVAGKALFQVASSIYLVTQTGISELRNSSRVIAQFFQEGNPNLEVVLNRVDEGIQGSANEDALARALGRPVDWKIPNCQDGAQMRCDDDASWETPIARASLEMATQVVSTPAAESRREISDQRGKGGMMAQANVQENEWSDSRTRTAERASAAPMVTWPPPAPIEYGEKLTSAQLNATASTAGKFVYTPGPGYLLPTGTHTLWVTFTPAQSSDEPLQVAVTIAVAKGTPELVWPAPAEITPGTALDGRHLNASSAVPGRFEYSPGPGAVLPPGSHTLSVTFTPADAANYNTAQMTQTVTVSRGIPIVDWAALEPVPYGTQLGAKQLCASASVPGRFEYTPGPGALLAAGEHQLGAVFTPEDAAGYRSARSVAELIVLKAAPEIVWPVPEPIPHGNALSAAQLNARAAVPGAFAYAPAAGEILSPGVHQLTAIFSPTDTLNYSSARAVASILVSEKLPVHVAWPAPAAISYGTALSATQLNAAGSVPGKFVYSPAAGNVLAPGRYTLSALFLPDEVEKYSTAKATVEIEVKGLANAPSISGGDANSASKRIPDTEPPALVAAATAVRRPASEATTRETRTYKGAVYEKGEDGQWHLQKT